jgi:Protein of unknown function (DUF3558)
MRVRRLLAVVAVLGMLSACTTERAGSPNPTSADRPSSPETTSRASMIPSSTQRLLPPRPRELDLTGIDPCADVLTGDQLRQLAYDLGYLDKPVSTKSDVHGGPACQYASNSPPDQPARSIATQIGISTSEGAEAWLSDPRRKTSAELSRPATVAGFPALVLPHPRIVDNCGVVVDVHKGQYLDVSSSPTGGRGTGPDPYCAEAQRVAEMVIQNLSARR